MILKNGAIVIDFFKRISSQRWVRKEDYKGEPVQFAGYYVLHVKDLGLPEPEVFLAHVGLKVEMYMIELTERLKQPPFKLCIK